MTAAAPHLTLATNNGDIGGGEVMFLLLAEAVRSLGVTPLVVAPSGPGEVAAAATERGLDVVALDADDRPGWMRRLRHWDAKHRDGVLWCNGMVPGLATAGHGRRVVQLHQPPYPRQRPAVPVMRFRAEELLVVSQTMAGWVPHTGVLDNWTADLPLLPRPPRADPVRLGFLGRLTQEKGVHLLAHAVAELDRRSPGSVRLVIGGEGRYASAEDQRVVGSALAEVEHLTERLGWVRPADFFAAIDLAVVPSDCAEPFGLVAAETMAAGVPFVVSDAGAFPEVVGPDHPWVCRQGSVPDLVATIEAALAAPEDEVARTIAAMRARWEERYSPAAGRERVATVLHRIGVL